MRKPILRITYRVSAALIVTLSIPALAHAATQNFTIVNDAHVPARQLAAVERAVAAQSHRLALAWRTPLVAFAAGGWKVTLRRDPTFAYGEHIVDYIYLGDWTCVSPGNCVGGPGATLQRTPAIDLWVGSKPAHSETWSEAFSHEIVETLADPYDGAVVDGVWEPGHEICDPVEGDGYRLDGQYVEDFVLPSYFAAGSRAPFDEAGVLAGGQSQLST